MKVPDVLLGGNHKEIGFWRKDQMLQRTKVRRIDLISQTEYINLQEFLIGAENSKNNTKLLTFNENDMYPDW